MQLDRANRTYPELAAHLYRETGLELNTNLFWPHESTYGIAKHLAIEFTNLLLIVEDESRNSNLYGKRFA